MRNTAHCLRCKLMLPVSAFDLKRNRPKGQCRKCCEADRLIAMQHNLKKSCSESNPRRKLRIFRPKNKPEHKPKPKRDNPARFIDGNGMTYIDRDSSLKNWGFKTYREYLDSPAWKAIRTRVFCAKGSRCLICDDVATQVHHTRYQPNDLAGVTLEHLHPICRVCHEAIEFDERGAKLSMRATAEKFFRLTNTAPLKAS